MIRITKLEMVTDACPTQWDGWTDTGDYYYFRYRWGRLTVCQEPLGEPVFVHETGDPFDGVMSTDTMKKLTSEKFEYATA